MAETKFAFQLGSALATNVLTYNKYIQGTYHVVETSAERDALTVKGTDDGVIVKGSLVYVSDDNKTYRWNGTAFAEESTGAAADAWNYKGAVADLDSLPTTASDGEVYTVTANSQNYFAKNEEDPENPGTNIVVWRLVAGYDITALETAIGKDADGNLVAVTDRIKDEAVNADYLAEIDERETVTYNKNYSITMEPPIVSIIYTTSEETPVEHTIVIGTDGLPYDNGTLCEKVDGSETLYSVIGGTFTYDVETKQLTVIYGPQTFDIVKQQDGQTIKEKIEELEEEIESKEELYTNENASTIEVGGIAKGSTFEGKTMKEMWDMLLYPYVAFDFTGFATADAAGTFEYGTTKTISSGKPSFTAGSKAITSIKIKDNDGAVVYEGTTATSGTSYDLAAPIAWDGKTEMTFTCELSDGTTTLTKTAKFAYNFPIYYAVDDSNTVAPTSGTAGNEVNITSGDNQYVWFFSQTAKSKIQQYVTGQWNDMETTSVGKVTFTLASGATYEYNAYVGPKMQASTCKLRIA